MTAPAEILDIAAVVLGEEPVHLDPPRRALALAAMNALGYSTAYMAEQLRVSVRTVAGGAGALKVKLDRRREFVDQLAVDFILQGTPMAVTGKTFDAALTALHARGKTCPQISRLTRTPQSTVAHIAERLGLTLAEETAECWWSHYFDTDMTRRDRPGSAGGTPDDKVDR